MNRTNIYLTDEQTGKLDEMARTEGISRSELIRRILDRSIESSRTSLRTAMKAIDESFGALAGEDVEIPRNSGERSRRLEELWRS